MFFDSHVHLDLPAFSSDLEAVLERAFEAGVETMVTVGIDIPSSEAAVRLADGHKCIYAAVGVSPHEAKPLSGASCAALRCWLKEPRVVALGEIGLDFYRSRIPRDVQIAVFRQQLDLAADAGKPVVIHSRDAHQEVLAILSSWVSDLGTGSWAAGTSQTSIPGQDSCREYGPSSSESSLARSEDRRLGVMHCFSGDWPLAQKVIGLGFLVSLSGTLTYPRSQQLAEIARRCPLESLLIETDSPFLPPQAYRGQRNEPAHVVAVARQLAHLRETPLEAVAVQTGQNAARLFGLGEKG